LNDAILAFQFCVGIEPSLVIHIGADINRDGKIGLKELIYILQKISDLRR